MVFNPDPLCRSLYLMPKTQEGIIQIRFGVKAEKIKPWDENFRKIQIKIWIKKNEISTL